MSRSRSRTKKTAPAPAKKGGSGNPGFYHVTNWDFNQYCKFKVKSQGEEYVIYLVCRPPSAGQSSKDKLCEMIAESQKNSVLVGDFNLPGTNWGGGAASGGNEGFVQALQDHYFEQLMDFPTHTKGNCLDLIVTNVPGTSRISNISQEGRLGKSDHGIICFDLLVDKKDFKESRNWRRAD